MGRDGVFHWGVLVSLGVSPGAKLNYSRVGCELPDAETEFDWEFREDREVGMEWFRLGTSGCGRRWI